MTEAINIPIKPGSKHFVRFTDGAISYCGKSIYYRDVESVRYILPIFEAQADYYYNKIFITGSRDAISIKVADRRGNHNAGEIRSAIRQFIEPVLIAKWLTMIFQFGHNVTIGNFILSADGIRSQSMLGGVKFAPWTADIQVEGKSKALSTNAKIHWFVNYFYPPTARIVTIGTIPSSVDNALLLEAVIVACREIARTPSDPGPSAGREPRG